MKQYFAKSSIHCINYFSELIQHRIKQLNWIGTGQQNAGIRTAGWKHHMAELDLNFSVQTVNLNVNLIVVYKLN